MSVNTANVGAQISALRKAKNLTQNELGERLNVTFQAVSKWERGETLPDTAVLPGLAEVLETTIDNILVERRPKYKGKLSAKDMIEGINCLERAGRLIGTHTVFYRQLIVGLSEKMNSDIEEMLADEFLRECLAAEIIIQNITAGYYFDLTEVRGVFKNEKWYNTVCEYARRYGIV